MADRYWVGGSATWNATAGSKWASTSGGVGGQTVPTSSDDVFIDSNSGAVTVTVSIPADTVPCRNLNCTGFTGSLVVSLGGDLGVYGSLTFNSTMTYTQSGGLSFFTTSTGRTITSAGKTFGSVVFNSTGGWIFQDSFTSGILTLFAGNLNTNGKTVTVSSVTVSGSSIKALTLGASTIVLTSTGTVWNITGSNFIFSSGSSIIKIIDASSSTKTFAGNNLTYFNLWLTGSGTGAFIIIGSNTFNEIRCDTPPHTIQFTAGTTTNLTSFVVSGSSAGQMIIQSTTSSIFTMALATGQVRSDYLTIRASTVTPSNTWFAGSHSIDSGGNSGWIFSDFTGVLTNIVDANNVPVLMGISNEDGGITIVNIKANSETHALLIEDATYGNFSGTAISRNDNGNPVIMAVSSSDGVTPVVVFARPTSGQLIVQST